MSEIGVWGKHPESHSSPDIQWSLCDECRELTVKPREWAKHERYGYYCNALHRNLTRKEIYAMTTAQCPVDRRLTRKWRK